MNAVLIGLALLGAVVPGSALPCHPIEEDPSDLMACMEYRFHAEVEGKGPVEVEWILPSGEVLEGQPLIFDTSWVGPGAHLLRVRATSEHGSDETFFPIQVQELEWRAPPTWKLADEELVEVRVWFQGGTEVRWDWGDGEWSEWWPQRCRGLGVGYHTYPPTGRPHRVKVEVRNCHGDVIEQSFLVGGSGQPPAITRFEAVCSSGLVCETEVGRPVDFALETTGDVDAFVYDWDGDGQFDQVSSRPITQHQFPAYGLFLSRVRVVQGPFQVEAVLSYPVAVLPDF